MFRAWEEIMSTAFASSRRRNGGAIVYTVIVLLVLIGFVGLAIDWGYMTWTAQKLQNGADAAALAGAQQIWRSHGGARDAAIDFATRNEAGSKPVTLKRNEANDANGDLVLGKYDLDAKTFTPSTDPMVANAVRVVARRTTGSAAGPLPLFFGPVFGKRAAEVERFGVAFAEGGPVFSDIIALDRHAPHAFYLYGDAYLNVGNGEGSVQVNSDNTTSNVGGSLVQGTKVQFLAGDLYVVGTNEERGKPSLPDIHEGEEYKPDPYALLPEPNVPSSATYPTKPKITGIGGGVQVDFHPGYYPQGLEMNAGDNVFLHPGVYVLDNGFHLNGHSKLVGYGVMFYLHTGSIHDNGTGDVYLTPPPVGHEYAGIQFFQARDNYEAGNFNGNTTWQGSLTDDPSTPINETTAGAGTFYFPEAHVEFGGKGNLTFNGLIAKTIEVYGTGDVNVTGGYETNKGKQSVYLIE
jgi:Flp pilus assembly protein TadG